MAQGFQSFEGSESAQQLCNHNVEFMECGDTQRGGWGGEDQHAGLQEAAPTKTEGRRRARAPAWPPAR